MGLGTYSRQVWVVKVAVVSCIVSGEGVVFFGRCREAQFLSF